MRSSPVRNSDPAARSPKSRYNEAGSLNAVIIGMGCRSKSVLTYLDQRIEILREREPGGREGRPRGVGLLAQNLPPTSPPSP